MNWDTWTVSDFDRRFRALGGIFGGLTIAKNVKVTQVGKIGSGECDKNHFEFVGHPQKVEERYVVGKLVDGWVCMKNFTVANCRANMSAQEVWNGYHRLFQTQSKSVYRSA